MADTFYSLHQDETALINYDTCIQQTGTSSMNLSTELSQNCSYFAPTTENNKRFSSSLRYVGSMQGNYNKTTSAQALKYAGQNFNPTSQNTGCLASVVTGNQGQQPPLVCQYSQNGNTCFNRNRYMPYNHNRSCAAAAAALSSNSQQFHQQYNPNLQNTSSSSILHPSFDANNNTEFTYANVTATNITASTTATSNNSNNNTSLTTMSTCLQNFSSNDPNQTVTLQINNLDYSMDEASLRNFLLGQLKPITPVVALVFEGSSCAKVTVPDLHFAKQVVANLHRKKVGHKRMIVSYTRDSSLTEINTLRCQVAGLLKDVPYCTLPMYKFRELFQSRFKTSISVLDLYKMQDICNITADKNEEKYISLQPELINSIETSPLIEGLQHSVPYCTIHFQREQHKGWAEQDIEPLPNVLMTISEIQQVIYPLLKSHTGDIPVASLVHCINGQLSVQIVSNDMGVNLEHLICCVHGIQIQTNNFGIKILGWLEPEFTIGKENNEGRSYSKNGSVSDPLYQISREVVELVKISPKSTMKFNRFIPAYHNHFGKQCRVADYGYTKLIELFEALSSVIQIMGDGENRQITLTHRTQIRRFTSDLLRILRAQGNKSILLSQLPKIFSQTQNRNFDITDYGVCDIVDILDGLVNSNIVVVTTVQNGKDILISIPKRKQTSAEIDKTCVFAGEVVELFRNAPQYSILFQKFVRSYHYHFGYQCRLSDYGFLKLADLVEAIQGVVELEFTNDEDKKIFLSPKVAQRVFAEQLGELIRTVTGSSKTCMKLDDVLQLHKKKFGYQIVPQTLGVERILDAIKILPYVELLENDETFWIICHFDDVVFRTQCYRSCKIIHEHGKELLLSMNDFINLYSLKFNETLTENTIIAMKHAIEIKDINEVKYVSVSQLMRFTINIVRIIDQRTIALSEIKSLMHFGVGYCFEFGFPNLYSLLHAYPDIFNIHVNASGRNEASLAPLGEFKSLISSTRSNSLPKIQGKKQSNLPQCPRPALSDCNRPAKMSSSALVDLQKVPQIESMDNSEISSNYQQFNVVAPLKKLPPVSLNVSAISQNNKENSLNMSGVNNNGLNRSLNSSGLSENNTSVGSNNTSGNSFGISKLWDRRQATNYYTGGIESSIFELMNIVPIYPSYEPPKPDTPPSDNMPFWIDPIWANTNGEKPPKIDSLNINLPEFKAFNLLPMLMSPYTLSKTENMKQNMFSFDNPDRKIA